MKYTTGPGLIMHMQNTALALIALSRLTFDSYLETLEFPWKRNEKFIHLHEIH